LLNRHAGDPIDVKPHVANGRAHDQHDLRETTTEPFPSVTPIILLLLAAMWAAVLLPSYLRGKGVGSGSSGGGAFAAAKQRMESFNLGGSGYVPVGGDLGPQQQQTPLPHGARYPVGSGPKAMRTSETFRPTSGSVQVLGETSNAISILGPAVDPDPTGPRATVTELQPRREQRAMQALASQPDAPREDDGSFVDEFGVRHEAPVGGNRASASPARRPAAGAHPQSAARGGQAGLSSRRAARQRRRQVFYSLLGSVGATFVLTFLVGGPMSMLFLLSLAALGGYVVLLLQVQKTEAERDIKVAFLPHGGQGAAPTTLLQQAGGSRL
jgi:hypothetical protein